jgi:hypothetical protein
MAMQRTIALNASDALAKAAHLFLRIPRKPKIHAKVAGPSRAPKKLREGIPGTMRAALWTLVVIVSVEFTAAPAGVTEPGLKVQVELAGRPEQLNCRLWLNPPAGVIERAVVAEEPCFTERDAGLRPTEKSGATTVTVALDEDAAKFVSPGYDAVMLSVPAEREVRLRVAVPPAREAVPSVVVPLEKVTVPVAF